MKKENYLEIYSKNKRDYLRRQKAFFEKEIKEERMFSKFLKESDIVIDEIVPWNLKDGKGAIVYTPDYSVVNNFEGKSFYESYQNPYDERNQMFSKEFEKLILYSRIGTGKNALNNYKIQLKDQEMELLGYDRVLKGSFFDNPEQLNDFVHKQIDFFKRKGMSEGLLKLVSPYLEGWSRGYDCCEKDPRL